MKRRILIALFCVFSFAGLSALAARESAAQSRLDVTGTVVGFSGRSAGRSYPLRLIVNRYTSPEEVARLTEATGGGQDSLLRALTSMDAGRIQIGSGVGLPANAIIRVDQPDGGVRLVVLFERNVRFFELRYGTRSSDYRFGYAEIFLDRNGRGQGTYIPAARVRLENGVWEIEDFGAFPARIMAARARGGGRF